MLTTQFKSLLKRMTFPGYVGPEESQMLSLLYQLEASQSLPPAEFKKRQFSQLSIVLKYAIEEVPYYKRAFKDSGITRIPETVDEYFIETLPLLKREDVYTAGNELHSKRIPPVHLPTRKIVTSGSTGVPVQLLGTPITQYFWHGFAMRDHDWHQRDFSKKICVIRWKDLNMGAPPGGTRFEHWNSSINKMFETGPLIFLNVATPLKLQAEWLLNEDPDYLLSFPSNLVALADYFIKNKLKLDKLIEIRTLGEMLTDEHREKIQHCWNVKINDIYTCEEGGYLAIQCPQHTHYHVQAENVYLEIINDEGKACLPGEIGRVVFTSLNNLASPLIRYEVGDLAEFGDTCDCGITLPVLKKIHGRKRNRIYHPDGRNEFPYFGKDGMFSEVSGVRISKVQFIQTSVEDLEVKVVAEKPFSKQAEDILTGMMQKNLGYPFNIIFQYPDDIPRGPSGKFEIFMSKVDPDE